MKVEISIDRETKVYELQTIAEFAANLAVRKSREEGMPVQECPGEGLKFTNTVTGKTERVYPKISEDPEKFANLTDKIPGVGAAKTDEHPEQVVIDPTADRVQEEQPEVVTDNKSEFEKIRDEYDEVKNAFEHMSEKELSELSNDTLIRILDQNFGINPSDHPGKNTNAKLRRLVMDAAKGKLEDIKEKIDTAEEAAPAEEVPAEEAGDMPFDEETQEEKKPVTIEMCKEEARAKIKVDRDAVLAAFKSCGCSSFGSLKTTDYEKFYNAVKAI